MKKAILFFLFVNGFLAANIGSAGESQAIGVASACKCAIFKEGDNELVNSPIVLSTNTTFKVDCTVDGDRDCQEACVILARAAKIRDGDQLCKVVQTDTAGFKPALYYKPCNHTEWEYTGHTCPVAICCLQGVQIPCRATTSLPNL